MSPLRGVKVIELGGLAPSPFCGMILADFGASVTVVDRTTPVFQPDILSRGKRSIALDIKKPKGAKVFKKMCLTADVIVEPFRTGECQLICPKILI
jgi:alpha-methylacyl-CoA racemase